MVTVELPENIGYGQVIGRFLLAVGDGPDSNRFPDGLPAKGPITFIPEPDWITNVTALTPVTIIPKTVYCTLDEEGYLIDPEGNRGVWLVATDDADLNPTGWTYRVQIEIEGEPRRVFPLEVPEGKTRDLAHQAVIGRSSGTVIVRGPQGDSAYRVAQQGGFTGTKSEWVASLKGETGDDSTVPGPANVLTAGGVTTLSPGSSATSSITGQSPEQTLALGIPQGDEGDSAYQVAVSEGFVGTEAAWLASLVGPQGVGVADIRTDTTVGTRVFVGNVMVYGDTGPRTLPMLNGWTASFMQIKRANNTVSLVARLDGTNATDDRIMDILTGMSPFGFSRVRYIPEGSLLLRYGTPWWLASSERIPINLDMTWETSAPWPKTLPGLPA